MLYAYAYKGIDINIRKNNEQVLYTIGMWSFCFVHTCKCFLWSGKFKAFFLVFFSLSLYPEFIHIEVTTYYISKQCLKLESTHKSIWNRERMRMWKRRRKEIETRTQKQWQLRSTTLSKTLYKYEMLMKCSWWQSPDFHFVGHYFRCALACVYVCTIISHSDGGGYDDDNGGRVNEKHLHPLQVDSFPTR